MKLRTNLFLLVLGTVVPFIALGVLLATLLVGYERESNRRGASDHARAVMTAVDAELRGAIGTLQALAASERLQAGDFHAFRREALNVLPSQSDWLLMTVTRPTGEQVLNTALPDTVALPSAVESVSLKRVFETRKPVVGDVFKSVATQQVVIPVRVPIMIGGEVPYALTAAIRVSRFQRLIEAQRLQPGWVIGLVDNAGHFVARQPAAPTSTASDVFLRHARSAPEGWYRGLTVEGLDTFTAHITSPLSGWIVGHAIPSSQMYESSIRATALLAPGALALVALAFAFAYWMGRRITTPVTALVASARFLGGAGAAGSRASAAASARSNIEEVQALEQALGESSQKLHAQFLERDRAEDALRKSEELARSNVTSLQTVLDTAPAIIWIARDAQCRTMTGNRAAYELSRVSEGEDMSKTGPAASRLAHYRVFHDDKELEPQEMPIQRVAASGEELSGYEMEFRFDDGTVRFLRGNVSPLLDPAGRSTGAIAAFVDITVRKHAEDALQAARTSAEQAQAEAEKANKAKDHFLAVLSHELRTPLTPVLAAVQVMERKPDLDPGLRLPLEIIVRNVQLEARLIDDLLDLTRIVEGKIQLNRQPLDICTVIERAVEICQPMIDARQLRLAVDLGDAPHRVDGDAARLQQVIWNVLNNAIKFTPEGGCIALRCHRRGGDVLVEVTDNGIGIPAEALPRIFNPFEQAEASITRRFGGLGLGLAIAKRLVELHGGTICAHSEGTDRGATFRVALPVTNTELLPQGVASRPAVPVASKRVLLVEDNADSAATMQSLLEISGYEVKVAADVSQALQAIESNEFDVLVSDLGLPDRSGIELMRELRRRGVSLKGIALTGYGQEEDVRRSREAGFSAHLVKPVDADVLIATMSRIQ